jgi:hypothetical protein
MQIDRRLDWWVMTPDIRGHQHQADGMVIGCSFPPLLFAVVRIATVGAISGYVAGVNAGGPVEGWREASDGSGVAAAGLAVLMNAC